MRVSDLLAAGEKAVPASHEPADLMAFWAPRAERACAPREAASEPAGFETPVATYRRLRFAATDGAELTARAVVPKTAGDHPCVVMFHDLDRGPRGWHHLTRFLALGYAVVELEGRPWSHDVSAGWQEGPKALVAAQLMDDALTCASVAAGLAGVDAGSLVVWGEGFGATLALAVAALLPGGVAQCCVLNPCLADVRGAWEAGEAQGFALAGVSRHFRDEDPAAERADEFFGALTYVDVANLAAHVDAELLWGVSLMDTVAPPLGQLAAYNRVPGANKRLVTYPKYVHERINDFENRFLAFVRFGRTGAPAPAKG